MRYARAILSAELANDAKRILNRLRAEWYEEVWTEEVRIGRTMKAFLHKIVSDCELLVLLLGQRGGFVECSGGRTPI